MRRIGIAFRPADMTILARVSRCKKSFLSPYPREELRIESRLGIAHSESVRGHGGDIEVRLLPRNKFRNQLCRCRRLRYAGVAMAESIE